MPKKLWKRDWTCDYGGTSNNSKKFNDLVEQVEMMIRGSAASLMAGQANQVARLIVAQLAHVHKMKPSD